MAIIPVKIFYQLFTTSKLDVLPLPLLSMFTGHTLLYFLCNYIHTTCKSGSLLTYKIITDKIQGLTQSLAAASSAFLTFVLSRKQNLKIHMNSF